MRRIGIMTFLHNENYGSILQAWALQKTLESLGFEAEHIDYAPSRKEKVLNLLRSGNSPMLILEGMRKRSATGQMRGGFDEFRREHLATSATCHDRAALKAVAARYDAVICGSDQIWSPVWLNPAYFLDYTDRPKISYAPSLGVAELPAPRKQKRIASLVKGFEAVSVREAEGAALLRQMAGVEAAVMPDPVMLVPQEQWRSLMPCSEERERYVLCYFIGDDASYWERVREAAQQEGCAVRVIPRTEGARQAGHPLEEDVPPGRWLSLLDGAARVVTDSFHAAAFSAILNTPCTILRRSREDDPESKNSRIDQLMRTLGVTALEAESWQRVNEAVRAQAEKGRNWLLGALSQATR